MVPFLPESLLHALAKYTRQLAARNHGKLSTRMFRLRECWNLSRPPAAVEYPQVGFDARQESYSSTSFASMQLYRAFRRRLEDVGQCYLEQFFGDTNAAVIRITYHHHRDLYTMDTFLAKSVHGVIRQMSWLKSSGNREGLSFAGIAHDFEG